MHPRTSGDGRKGREAVRFFRVWLSRLPGPVDAHKSLTAGMMGVWCGRDLASAKAAADPVEQVELKTALRNHYGM